MDSAARQAALDRARRGDAAARGEVLDGFRPYIRRIVHGFVDERVQAKLDDADLVQEILLQAHQSFDGFRGATVAEAVVWVRRIAVRTAERTLRGLSPEAAQGPGRETTLEDPDDLAGSVSTPSRQAMRREDAERLTQALAVLPHDMQVVVLSRHVDGLPHGAVARRLGRTEAAVRVLYVRALQRLGELFRE